MHRGYWEIEVFARDFQERRWQEAAKHRRADEAMRSAPREGVNAFDLGIARLMTRATSWLATRRPVMTPAAAPRGLPEIAPEIPQQASQTPPPRHARPYGDMVVIARRPLVDVAEQPCGVSDC